MYLFNVEHFSEVEHFVVDILGLSYCFSFLVDSLPSFLLRLGHMKLSATLLMFVDLQALSLLRSFLFPPVVSAGYTHGLYN